MQDQLPLTAGGTQCRVLVQLIHGIHHSSQLCLQGVSSTKVQVLGTSSCKGQLVLHLQQQGIHQVRVLDDDGDLGEHALIADVKVLDRLRGEVSFLEHLYSLLGHSVSFH